MVTFNEKHHWAFPLVPSSCDYAKLGEYFGKLRNAEIEAMQMRAISENIRGRAKSRKAKSKANGQNGEFKSDCFGHERRNPKHFCENGECSCGMRGSQK